MDGKIFWSKFDYYVSIKGISLLEFCNVNGFIYKSVISMRYRGQLPKVNELVKIADALQMPIDMLLGREIIKCQYPEKLQRIIDILLESPELIDAFNTFIGHNPSICKKEEKIS